MSHPQGFDFERQQDTIRDLEDNRPEPNDDYEPKETERRLLRILKDEVRATSGLLKKRGGFDTNYTSEMLYRLADEGYVWRVVRPNENNYGQPEEITGFYAYNAQGTDFDAELDVNGGWWDD